MASPEPGLKSEFEILLGRLHQAHVNEVARLHAELETQRHFADVASLQSPGPQAHSASSGWKSAEVHRGFKDELGSDASSAAKAEAPRAGKRPLGAGSAGSASAEDEEEEMMQADSLTSAIKEVEERGWRKRGKDCHHTSLRRLVTTVEYELFSAAVIGINAVVVALQLQFEGQKKGREVAYPGINQLETEKMPWLEDTLDLAGNLIGAFFALELLLKVIALGPFYFPRDSWNWLDTFIVLFWLMDEVFGTVALPISPRSMRVFRLLRLLRILRLTKTIQAFDALHLLNAALRASVAVLSWSLAFLAAIQLTLALLVTQGLQAFYFDNFKSGQDPAEYQQVYQYFGTTSRSVLTMFEMTLANWPPVCRIMTENVTEWWMVVAVLHKLTLGFAVVGIINGVVMQETFKAAGQDFNVVVRNKRRAKEFLVKRIRLLFEEALAGTGKSTMTIEEFERSCHKPDMKIWLETLGLKTQESRRVFRLLDDGDGELTAEEVVHGVERFKEPASGIDLLSCLKDVHVALHKLDQLTQVQKHIMEVVEVLQAKPLVQQQVFRV